MKVLAIALDAADKDLLLEWAADGRLPALRELLATSGRAVTEGPLAMHAGSVWPSIATASSPAYHGRHSNRQILPGTYETRRMDDLSEAAMFWAALARAGRRAALVDVPEVPLAALPGITQIMAWTAHEADARFETAPPELADEIVRRFGRNTLGLCDHMQLDGADAFARFRDGLIEQIGRKVDLCRHLVARSYWDLFLVVFGESHCAGHRCWHLHDSTHPHHVPDEAARVGDPIEQVYRALDRAVGDLAELAGPDTALVLLSSHGIGPNYNGDHLLGEVLARLGYGAPVRDPNPFWQAVRWAWRRLPLALRTRLTPAQKRAVDSVWPSFDSRASCFQVGNSEVWSAVRVNLAGREPAGRIEPGAGYESFCDALARDLLALVNGDTGEPAVLRVLRTADVYDGPKIDELPDLMIQWNGAAPLRAVVSPKTGTVERAYNGPRTGHHRPEGMILVRAPGIPPGPIGRHVSVIDVAPTLCALIGHPLEGVEGRPIEELLPHAARSVRSA